MEFRILGPLEADDDEGNPVLLGGPKVRALLVDLLLNAGRTVSRERLIDDLWGERVPASANKMVQVHVMRLRKVLRSGVLETRPSGYAVALDRDVLDLHRFERLVAEGREALAAGEPEAASHRLREALALWRGPALAEFGEPFAIAESARLEEARLAALDDGIEADLALGRQLERRILAQDEELSAAGEAPQSSSRDAGARRPPVRYARSGDLNIAYQISGAGPLDLVLVSGFISHLEKDWEDTRHAHFLDRLASFSRLIRFDKRGTGLSDRPGDLPDLETRMDDVRAVMDAAGSERAVLFGYSEGGPMSLLFAATYPERVSALVLYGAFAARTPSEDYPWATAPAERAVYGEQIEREWGWEADMHHMCPNADRAMARWWGERARAAASPGAARALIAMNSTVDVRHVLPAIRAPTLVLHRTGDLDTRVEEGRYMAERIPGARFVELAGEDHFVAIEPDQILDEVERFLLSS